MEPRPGQGYTRFLYGLIWKDLPIVAGIWALVVAGATLLIAVTGKLDVREALAIGAACLPLVIPLGPLIWLRYDIRARAVNVLPALGLGCLWMFVTMPLAVGLGLLLSRLVNGGE